jgi:competence protein ComEA
LIVLNRQEALAVWFLSGALLVGTAVSIVDHYDAQRFEEFHVVVGAVAVPDVARVEVPAKGPVPINQARAEQLQSLPHIGPKTAAVIVDYRQKHGKFSTVEQLSRVRGIGATTVERLKDHVSLK